MVVNPVMDYFYHEIVDDGIIQCIQYYNAPIGTPADKFGVVFMANFPSSEVFYRGDYKLPA